MPRRALRVPVCDGASVLDVAAATNVDVDDVRRANVNYECLPALDAIDRFTAATNVALPPEVVAGSSEIRLGDLAAAYSSLYPSFPGGGEGASGTTSSCSASKCNELLFDFGPEMLAMCEQGDVPLPCSTFPSALEEVSTAVWAKADAVIRSSPADLKTAVAAAGKDMPRASVINDAREQACRATLFSYYSAVAHKWLKTELTARRPLLSPTLKLPVRHVANEALTTVQSNVVETVGKVARVPLNAVQRSAVPRPRHIDPSNDRVATPVVELGIGMKNFHKQGCADKFFVFTSDQPIMMLIAMLDCPAALGMATQLPPDYKESCVLLIEDTFYVYGDVDLSEPLRQWEGSANLTLVGRPNGLMVQPQAVRGNFLASCADADSDGSEFDEIDDDESDGGEGHALPSTRRTRGGRRVAARNRTEPQPYNPYGTHKVVKLTCDVTFGSIPALRLHRQYQLRHLHDCDHYFTISDIAVRPVLPSAQSASSRGQIAHPRRALPVPVAPAVAACLRRLMESCQHHDDVYIGTFFREVQRTGSVALALRSAPPASLYADVDFTRRLLYQATGSDQSSCGEIEEEDASLLVPYPYRYAEAQHRNVVHCDTCRKLPIALAVYGDVGYCQIPVQLCEPCAALLLGGRQGDVVSSAEAGPNALDDDKVVVHRLPPESWL